MLEFALVLPVFAMLVVGLFSSAMLYDSRMQLTHAAREGARYGATVPVEQSFDSGGWADNLMTLVNQRGGSSLTGADVCIALVAGDDATPVSADHTTDPLGGRCFDDSASGEEGRRVQVAITKTMTLDVVAFRRDVTLSSTATSRHESHG
jgi:Flp pilus assembly protein TadG